MANTLFKTVKIILAELDKGGYHLFVNVKVNGKRCRFLIDTGASRSVIDKTYFEKHVGKRNLKTIKLETTGLHSSVPESHFGKVKMLEIGKLAIKNQSIAAIDLSHVNMTYAKLQQPKIQGILGSDYMMQYKMIIDYGQGKIFIP